MEGKTVIAGGEVVSAEGVRRADVLIEGERIAAIGAFEAPRGAEIVDASGKLVLPGAVDVHTHFDMAVGAVRSADDFLTGTTAAACGGTTTIVDFATAYRGETASVGLAAWHAKAAGKAVVDYAFHMTVTELTTSADDLVAEMAESGVTSFKLYMTYRDRLMVDDDVIVAVMRAAGRAGSMVCLHCEDNSMVEAGRAAALAAGHTGPRWHAWSRPPEAEASAVARAVAMAEQAETCLYVVHLSSAPALEEVRRARERGVPVFAETCPQYLYLSAERYEEAARAAARYVCAPPLRDPHHAEELWEGLRRGHIQVVATDHCPFTDVDKERGVSGRGWTDFTDIPGGLPGVETRLSLVYQKVAAGLLTPEEWVSVCCTTPAKLFGLWPAKGDLAPGADADVVVFDPSLRRPLEAGRLHMRVDYSPYEELVVAGWPSLVLSRGTPVARSGEPVAGAPRGRFVARAPGMASEL